MMTSSSIVVSVLDEIEKETFDISSKNEDPNVRQFTEVNLFIYKASILIASNLNRLRLY